MSFRGIPGPLNPGVGPVAQCVAGPPWGPLAHGLLNDAIKQSSSRPDKHLQLAAPTVFSR